MKRTLCSVKVAFFFWRAQGGNLATTDSTNHDPTPHVELIFATATIDAPNLSALLSPVRGQAYSDAATLLVESLSLLRAPGPKFMRIVDRINDVAHKATITNDQQRYGASIQLESLCTLIRRPCLKIYLELSLNSLLKS